MYSDNFITVLKNLSTTFQDVPSTTNLLISPTNTPNYQPSSVSPKSISKKCFHIVKTLTYEISSWSGRLTRSLHQPDDTRRFKFADCVCGVETALTYQNIGGTSFVLVCTFIVDFGWPGYPAASPTSFPPLLPPSRIHPHPAKNWLTHASRKIPEGCSCIARCRCHLTCM